MLIILLYAYIFLVYIFMPKWLKFIISFGNFLAPDFIPAIDEILMFAILAIEDENSKYNRTIL